MSNEPNLTARVAEALQKTAAIIPVWNEEAGIGGVLDDLPPGVIPVVVDNGSTDRTVEIARSKGATVVHEKERGYGAVCMGGIRALPEVAPRAEYVVFIDGDHADHPEELPAMLEAIVKGEADMVLGSRVTGQREPGALPLQSRFAIWYARKLLWRLFRIRCTDIGPFRVMPLWVLRRLEMSNKTWGWTVEMQAKAARLNLRMKEVPARYRKRPGASKISGALVTAIKAGWKVFVAVIRYRFSKFDTNARTEELPQ
jgi:glycosyltransferase involved in cell wall biosynthesis